MQTDQITDSTEIRSASDNLFTRCPVWLTLVLIAFFLYPLPYWPYFRNLHIESRTTPDRILVLLIMLQWQWLPMVLIAIGTATAGIKFWNSFGQTWRNGDDLIRDARIGLWLAMILIAIDWVLVLLLGAFYQTPHHHLIPETYTELALFLVLMLGAGLCEELIFRGYLLRQFQSFMSGNWALALIAQAILFSLAHGYDQTAVGYLEKFIFGLACGYVVRRRGSLTPAIVTHATIDVCAGLIAFFFVNQ